MTPLALMVSASRPEAMHIPDGFLNVVVSLLLWAVPLFNTHYLVALGIAQAVCLCFAFSTYKFGVFRTRGDILREFTTFSGYYLFNYAANWAALPLLVEVGRISPVIAQLGFTAVLIVGSWFWHNRVTFRAGRRS